MGRRQSVSSAQLRVVSQTSRALKSGSQHMFNGPPARQAPACAPQFGPRGFHFAIKFTPTRSLLTPPPSPRNRQIRSAPISIQIVIARAGPAICRRRHCPSSSYFTAIDRPPPPPETAQPSVHGTTPQPHADAHCRPPRRAGRSRDAGLRPGGLSLRPGGLSRGARPRPHVSLYEIVYWLGWNGDGMGHIHTYMYIHRWIHPHRPPTI